MLNNKRVFKWKRLIKSLFAKWLFFTSTINLYASYIYHEVHLSKLWSIKWSKAVGLSLLIIFLFSILTGATAFSNSYFGGGSGPIHIGGLECTGQESSLTQCSLISYDIDGCYHSNDAGVR